MFEVNLKTQVSCIGPDANKPNWGGPACCQMAMGGYPLGATSCNISQTTIWNYIQANNKEGGVGPWGIGWYSDPFAITKTLNDLCPPQHSWIDVSGTNKETVLYTLFRWMANYKYASLVCTFAHDYWIALVYYKTSDDPRVVTNPTLERIGWNEPSSPGSCIYKEVDGSVWMSSPYYWGLPCGGFASPCGQIWKNKWVGIGEPPEEEGSIQVEIISRVGEELINPKDATRIAEKFVVERLREKSENYDELSLRCLSGVQPLQPMLVREMPLEQETEKQERWTDQDIKYYLVPFINKYDVDKLGAPLSRLSVAVNAYTGRFEELCIFPKPVRYLSEREAIWIASRNLNLSRHEIQRMDVELVNIPQRPSVSTAQPAWRVSIDKKELFATQDGTVVGGLYPITFKGK